MSNISIINSDRSFAIRFFNFKYNDDSDYNYFQYKLCIENATFKVSTDTCSFVDELYRFRENLISFLRKEIKIIYFAPLEGTWQIKLSWRDAEIISLEGGVSDIENIRSNLEFNVFLSIEDLLKTAKELGDFLTLYNKKSI
jgi:hypothetical protein